MLLLTGLVAGALGCGSATETTFPADQRRAVRALLEEQVQAWNRGDIEGFMAGYWQSDSLVFASGGTITRGWNTVLDRYKISYGTPELMGKLDFELIQIDVLGPDHAKVLGKWRVQRTESTLWGLFTLILRRFPNGWRIVHDHTSSGKTPGTNSDPQ